jgi:hypothetical protein
MRSRLRITAGTLFVPGQRRTFCTLYPPPSPVALRSINARLLIYTSGNGASEGGGRQSSPDSHLSGWFAGLTDASSSGSTSRQQGKLARQCARSSSPAVSVASMRLRARSAHAVPTRCAATTSLLPYGLRTVAVKDQRRYSASAACPRSRVQSILRVS